MVSDPVADLIVRIKNAGLAKRPSISIPYSNLKWAISEILSREGFVGSIVKRGKKAKKFIDIELKYTSGRPEVTGTSRVSRLGKRVYYKADQIKPVKFGHGLMIISTPRGLKTDTEARKEHIGGEALLKIW